MTALTEADLDARIADKRIHRVIGKDGKEVGRMFRDTQAAWPCEWECCTGNCTENNRECLRPAEACTELGADGWTQTQINYLRVIAWGGSPLFVVGVIALAALYLS